MDERVLLVEDDSSIREVAALGLTQAGFAVTTAPDGRQGLLEFRQGTFDLVVLDVMLPELDGFEVCREIRRESRVPIVMLSARGDTVDVVVGLELGADDYVTKPFELPELVARARAVMRRASEDPPEQALAVGALEIDPGGFEVRRDGKRIELTATEFRL
ncbi:MAG: response regulator, partial [Gaiellaceae bacterium]